MGIRHHVLLKPNRRSSLVGTATNMVALGTHHRRNHIWVANNRPETVGGTPEGKLTCTVIGQKP